MWLDNGLRNGWPSGTNLVCDDHLRGSVCVCVNVRGKEREGERRLCVWWSEDHSVSGEMKLDV